MPKDATGLIFTFVLNVDEYRHKTVPSCHTLGRLGWGKQKQGAKSSLLTYEDKEEIPHSSLYTDVRKYSFLTFLYQFSIAS